MSSQNINLPDLGPVFTAQQVADYLQLDVNTVRKYYKELGGVRVGSAYRFFKRTLTDAILRHEEKPICGTDPSKREVCSEVLSHPKGSVQVGNRTDRTQRTADKFNLLN